MENEYFVFVTEAFWFNLLIGCNSYQDNLCLLEDQIFFYLCVHVTD